MLFAVGLAIVLGSILGGYMPHGDLAVLWQPLELLIIAGCAFGAFVISNPKNVIIGAFKGSQAREVNLTIEEWDAMKAQAEADAQAKPPVVEEIELEGEDEQDTVESKIDADEDTEQDASTEDEQEQEDSKDK